MDDYDFNKLNQARYGQTEFGYTFVQGIGFVPFSQAHRERSSLVTCANAIGLSVLLFLFLRVSIPPYVAAVFKLFVPRIRYFNSHLMAPEWVVESVSAICFILCITIAYGLYMLFIRIPPKAAFPFKRPQPMMLVPAVFISLAVSVLGSLATSVISRLLGVFGLIPIMPAINTPSSLKGFVFALLNLCILPALLEECVFRGVLMQSLRRFGDGFALMTSAVVFSILHLNLLQAPVALLMGLVMGYFVLRTGSLWTGIIIHFFNNLLALLQQLVMDRISSSVGELTNLLVVLGYLLLGLLSLVLLSRSTDGLFYLNRSNSMFSMRQKVRLFFFSPSMIITMVLIISISMRNIQLLPR